MKALGILILLVFVIISLLNTVSNQWLIDRYCKFKAQQEGGSTVESGFTFRDRESEDKIEAMCLNETENAKIYQVLVKYGEIDRTDCEFCF